MPPARRKRERANVLETQESSRKLRLICLASAAMSGYMQVRELLHDELQNPLDMSAEHAAEDEAHDQELFDFAFGHNHMLLMAQFALLLSAAKPYFKPGRTYSVGPEVYSFARIERTMSTSTCSCKGTFRFEQEGLRELFALLQFPPIVKLHNCTCTGEEIFLYMLRRLSYPSTQVQLALECGRRPCEQSQMFEAGLAHIFDNFAHLRDERSLEAYSDDFPRFSAAIKRGGAKGPVPCGNVIGFLDGSNQYVCKPSVAQELLYNGHKRRHVIKWQGLQLPNGIMPMPFGPISGRHHDSHMLNCSGLVRVMRRISRWHGRTFRLYGDPAYPQSQWIGGPYRGPALTDSQVHFNSRMSSTRIVNEWGFGRIKTNWAFLDFENGMKPYLNDTAKFWPVASILMNCHVCLYGSATAKYFDCQTPSLEQYLTNFGRNVM